MADFFEFLTEQALLVGILLTLIYLFLRNESRRAGQVITVHQLTQMVNQDSAVIVDVREAKEYKEGHITDALNFPFGKLAEHLKDLEDHKDKPLILVDKVGQHSGAAGRILRAAGFDVKRLDGGITEWKNNNLPLLK